MLWRLSLLAGSLLLLGSPAHSVDQACRALIVTRAMVAYAHLTTIQAAVDAARPCDWVLVAPGVYRGSVVVRTPRLHLRGVDRNRVVLDGENRPGNGIDVRAADVWIENLSVRDFDRRSLNDDRSGNEIRWRSTSGWHGNYLTVSDTGTLGGYGLYAAGSPGGEWDHVTASGFNDSGLYVGACRECEATISHALAERNAYGFAATNASGHLVVEDSVFRDNTIGVTANSSVSDPPPPQLGSCDAAANRLATPTISSTVIAHCTVFRGNRIVANNNLSAPANTSSLRPAAGIGIALMGTYGDLVSDNLIVGNRTMGILAVELPYTKQKRRPPRLHFQLQANRLEGNVIRGARFSIVLEGGLFGSRQSINNCVADNRYARSLPADLAPFACAHSTTPNPDPLTSRLILQILSAFHTDLLAHHPGSQSAPPLQQTMPDPCAGAPANPLCQEGAPSPNRT